MMSGKRKKHSGHAYRELAKQKAKRLKEQLDSTPKLQTFFKQGNTKAGDHDDPHCTHQQSETKDMPVEPKTDTVVISESKSESDMENAVDDDCDSQGTTDDHGKDTGESAIGYYNRIENV